MLQLYDKVTQIFELIGMQSYPVQEKKLSIIFTNQSKVQNFLMQPLIFYHQQNLSFYLSNLYRITCSYIRKIVLRTNIFSSIDPYLIFILLLQFEIMGSTYCLQSYLDIFESLLFERFSYVFLHHILYTTTTLFSYFPSKYQIIIDSINIYNFYLMQEANKTWLGDKYEGDMKQGWYHGVGTLTMSDGVVYEGQFVKGHFHGEGKLIYPNGGYYLANWQEGKMINGDYFFSDNLQYENKKWNHCQQTDRRYYGQVLNGIKPSGATQQTRQQEPHIIPCGTYDTGDGYYEPVKSLIYTFEGAILRTPSQSQVKFIMQKCRYVPKAVEITGEKDRIIKRVLQKQKDSSRMFGQKND